MPDTIPRKRRTALGLTLAAFDPIATKPGNSTYSTCVILVPYRHRLLNAYLACTDIDNVGAAMAATLKRAASGAAFTGAAVGTALTNAQLAATADLVSTFEFALAAADREQVPANYLYYVDLTGTNAGDHIELPRLTIVVDTIPRGAL